MNILFICRGNVGRSQMAEAIFNILPKNNQKNSHNISSAGTRVIDKDGVSQHGQMLKDLPAAKYVVDVLHERGIEVAENSRTQLNPEMVSWADKIIVIAEPHTIPEYLSASSKTVYWEVEDPKGTSRERYLEIMNHIESLLKKWIEENGL